MNTKLDILLTRFDGVRKTGAGRFIAKCPAHNDRSPSLAITQVDEKILLHCFAGCAVGDVLAAVGMELSDLFPDKAKASSYSGKPARFNAYDVLRCLKTEAGILTLAASDCVKLGVFSEVDALRVELARTRIYDAIELVWGGEMTQLVGSWDEYLEAMADDEQDEILPISLFDANGGKKSQSTLLIEIASQHKLFHCPQNDAYIEISDQGITKIFQLRTRDFRELLGHEFFKLTGKGANTTAISDALNTLEAISKHEGEEHAVYIRLANLDDKIIIDIGCHKWHVIEVTRSGWRILDKSPVKFYRKRGMTSLSMPTKGGSINQLMPFINVEADDFKLVAAWLLSVLGGVKPFPILILQGEQGTGKSTTSRILRALTDPSTVPLRSPPKDVKDLLVSAANNYVVVLDNLSGLSPELSDCLCRLSTGGGIDPRSLYTDNEQFLVDIQRPIIVNGIDDVASRPDLSERSIHLELPVIDGGKRNDEKTFYADFDKVKGEIFGALLTGLACALTNIKTTVLSNKPRMADFAKWVTAAESGLSWRPGDFMRAYQKNRDSAITAGIESSPVGLAIMGLVEKHPNWTGTPTELLRELENIAGLNQIKSRSWPQSPKGLSNAIKRLTPNFRALKIEIVKTHCGINSYTIRNVAIYPSYPSKPSKPSDDAGLAWTDSGRIADAWTDSPLLRTDSKTPQATYSKGLDGYKPTFPNDVERF
jgi:hypothetical protein